MTGLFFGRRLPCSGDAARSTVGVLVEQVGELADNGAAKLVDIGNGDGTTVVPGHIVTDADGQQFNRRAGLDIADHFAEMFFEIAAAVYRQRRIIDRRAIGDNEENAPVLTAGQKALMRPDQSLAVDVLLQDSSRSIRPSDLRARRQGASAPL